MGALSANLQVTAGQLPSGVCYDHDENARLQAYAERLIVSLSAEYATFQYGDVAPASDLGPWFNTSDNNWWVWDSVSAAYIPLEPTAITGEVPVGVILAWGGTIASVATFFNTTGGEWAFCNGAAISRTTYALLFSIIGTQYGVGDGVSTYNIPDLRDFMIAGAKSDSAGTAMSSIADPLASALLKSRVYTAHTHQRVQDSTASSFLASTARGSSDRISREVENGSPAQVYNSADDINVIPPFVSLPFVIRTK